MDYSVYANVQTWSIGVLSIMALFAISWQVYSAYSFEKRMKEFVKIQEESMISRIDTALSAIEGKHYKYRCEAIGTALFNLAEAMYQTENYGLALNNYIKALVELTDEQAQTEEVDLCYDRLSQLIHTLKEYSISIPDNELNTYLSMISNLPSTRKYELIKFLLSFK